MMNFISFIKNNENIKSWYRIFTWWLVRGLWRTRGTFYCPSWSLSCRDSSRRRCDCRTTLPWSGTWRSEAQQGARVLQPWHLWSLDNCQDQWIESSEYTHCVFYMTIYIVYYIARAVCVCVCGWGGWQTQVDAQRQVKGLSFIQLLPFDITITMHSFFISIY